MPKDSDNSESSSLYLSDISPRDKSWDDHKSSSRIVAANYSKVDLDRYSKRIWECSHSLEFALKRDAEGRIRLKLSSTRFCRVRWCPVCLWRRSLMWRARFIKALPEIIKDYPRSRFILLTLTVRNCPIGELRETLSAMNAAWIRLTKRKVFPATGWVKSIEVTRGRDGSAHPHLHCLLMVNPSYFTHGYLSQEKWKQLWKDCLRLDYDPVVDIRKVKPKKQSVDSTVYSNVNATAKDSEVNSIILGILEVVKYCVKPDDLVKDPEWLLELTKQMHKTRSIGLGGIFKKYLSEYEPEDLINADIEDEVELKDEDMMLIFDWGEIVRRYTQRK
jgi:plasmid rolling circle replication initiator protein Rep